MPGRFDFAQLPLPQYAVPAAAFRLTLRDSRCRNRKRGRFFWRTMIALIRRRMWASMVPNYGAASAVQRR